MNYLQEINGPDGIIGVMNIFSECLEISQNGRAESFWIEVYKKTFPNMTNCMQGKKEYSKSQEYGVDRIIYLENGKCLTIDEKCRTKNYPDIALEYISNDKKNTPGWMEKDLSIDYLAYAFLPIKRAYIFDWRMLKRVWNKFKIEWLNKYFIAKAENEYYYTLSVCVPIDELKKQCSNAIIIQL